MLGGRCDRITAASHVVWSGFGLLTWINVSQLCSTVVALVGLDPILTICLLDDSLHAGMDLPAGNTPNTSAQQAFIVSMDALCLCAPERTSCVAYMRWQKRKCNTA